MMDKRSIEDVGTHRSEIDSGLRGLPSTSTSADHSKQQQQRQHRQPGPFGFDGTRSNTGRVGGDGGYTQGCVDDANTPVDTTFPSKRRRLNDSTFTPSTSLPSPSLGASDTMATHTDKEQASSTPSTSRPQSTTPTVPHVSTTATTYTTSSGSVLTLQNAGFILSAYLQSYGLDPSHFRATSTFTLVPPTTPTVHKRPLKSSQAHQPPPDSLFHCTMTLPKPCPVSTLTSPGEGYRSKDLAKKHVSMEIIKLLIQSGEVTPDLKPRPRDRVPRRERRYAHLAESVQRTIAGPLDRTDPAERQQKAEDFKKGLLDRTALSKESVGIVSDPILKGVAEYPHIPNARFWSHCPVFRHDDLYPTIIELILLPPYDQRTKECRTLCLITSKPLPIFDDSGVCVLDMTNHNAGTKQETVGAKVKLTRGKRMKTWEEGKLDDVMVYTQRLIRALINKPAEGSLENSRWLIVPLLPDFQPSDKVRRRDISWKEIEQAKDALCSPFSFDNPAKLAEEVVDAMSTPNYEFSRRMYVKAIRSDLTPSSIDPNDSTGSKNLLKSFSATVTLTQPEQVILQTDVVNGIRHGGFITGVVNPKLVDKYIIPELAYRHSISASVYKTATSIPSLLSSIDDLLVAKELSEELFDGKLDTPTALSAITCPTAHGSNYSKSYQRLEMLGDTLLKLLLAVYLLYKLDNIQPVDWDTIHQDRQVLASNRTLQAKAIEAGVVPYIRGASGKGKEWLPMGWEAKEPETGEKGKSEGGKVDEDGKGESRNDDEGAKTTAQVETSDNVDKEQQGPSGNALTSIGNESTVHSGDTKNKDVKVEKAEPASNPLLARSMSPTRGQRPDKYQSHMWSTKKPRPDDPVFLKQNLGDKTVADIAESLVAASYLSQQSNIDGAIRCLHILKMPLEGFTSWEGVVEYTKEKNAKIKAEGPSGPPMRVLGYEYSVPQNGRDALTLSAEPARKSRFLQFKILGDAVLDYFMVEGLFNAYPTEGPGSLTVMRHSRHGDSTLSAYSITSGLIDLVTDVPLDFMLLITKTKKAVTAAKVGADGCKDEAGRWEFWAEIQTLNFMGDIVNAFFGSILVDSNYNLTLLRGIYERTLLPFLEMYCVGPGERGPHPRTVWSEMIFKRGCQHWKIDKEELSVDKEITHKATVHLHGQVIGRGEAETQSIAMRKACEEAVKKVKSQNLLEKVCTCPKKKKKREL